MKKLEMKQMEIVEGGQSLQNCKLALAGAIVGAAATIFSGGLTAALWGGAVITAITCLTDK